MRPRVAVPRFLYPRTPALFPLPGCRGRRCRERPCARLAWTRVFAPLGNVPEGERPGPPVTLLLTSEERAPF